MEITTRLENSFADKLKVEGVNFKGFGIIPKYVMVDSELSLEAKAIYAYFCSFSGNGNAAFPIRDKIIYDLKINKDTYYKHFQMLVEQGYIIVKQNTNKQGTFANNVYTLVSNPKKVQLSLEADSEKWSKVMFDRLRVSGVKAWGYGMIPKAVMIDPRLPLKAKGIYAYFAAFSGSGGYAFPKKDKIQYHLGISEPTYYKFYSLLTNMNYITAVQRHVEGRLQVNDYFLNDMPDEMAVPDKGVRKKNTGLKNFGYGKNEENTALKDFGHGENAENTGDFQDLKISDTEEPENAEGSLDLQDLNFSDTAKQDTVKQDTVNWDTNINSIKSNSISSISLTHSFITEQAEDCQNERMSDHIALEVKKEILREKGIPFSYKADEHRMTEAIHFMTEWKNLYPNGYCDELRQRVYNLFNEALIQMCMSDQMNLKGSYVTYAKVIERINKLAKFEENYVDLSEFSEVAIENYYQAALTTTIKYPLKYMESCIWDALLTGSVGMYSDLKRQFGI